MKTQNKLSEFFDPNVKASASVNNSPIVDPVNDPRIDSPEIQVIYSDLEKVNSSEQAPLKKTETEIDKEVALEEFVFTAKKEEADIKTEKTEPHVCSVTFSQGFKQHWMPIVGIALGTATITLGLRALIVKSMSK